MLPGSNVISLPWLSTATQTVKPGAQDRAFSPPPMLSTWKKFMSAGVLPPLGLKVTTLPFWSITAHILHAVLQAKPLKGLPMPTVYGVGVPGLVGLNVTSRPSWPTTVHRFPAALQATA